jgi:LmbE family N-acetylglucosaminyl deacetylase
MEQLRILVIGAHPDDVELGCGATIHRRVANDTVRCVTMSNCNPGYPATLLYHPQAVAYLGVTQQEIHTIPDCAFEQHRQEVLAILEECAAEFRPHAVFVTSPRDDHQDHQTLAREARRAFRHTTLFYYSAMYSQGAVPNYFVEVSLADVEAKEQALATYANYRDRPYFQPEYLRSVLSYHGGLVGCRFAEGFTVDRLVHPLT